MFVPHLKRVMADKSIHCSGIKREGQTTQEKCLAALCDAQWKDVLKHTQLHNA